MVFQEDKRVGNSNAQTEVSMAAALRSMPIFIAALPQKIRITHHSLTQGQRSQIKGMEARLTDRYAVAYRESSRSE